MQYELRAPAEGLELGPQEIGACSKECVPGLVLQIVQESERNIQIATEQKERFDYQDALLEEDYENLEGSDATQYESDWTTLILRAMTPAFLLFHLKGKKSKNCRRCGGVPLLKYFWHYRNSNECGVCCHQCAFSFCGMVLGSSIENEVEATKLDEAESGTAEQDEPED